MNRSLLSLPLLTLLSYPVLAVENGEPVDWEAHNNTVRLDSSADKEKYCTATLIAGRYAITAAHCLDDEGLDEVTTAFKERFPIRETIMHPNYYEDDGFSSEDVGLVTVDTPIDYTMIQFINIDDPHTEGEPITIAGFGGTIYTLNSVEFTFSRYHNNDPFVIYTNDIDGDEESHTTGGDSGAAWVNQDNQIMGIHKGSDVTGHFDEETGEDIKTRETYGTDLAWHSVKTFLTETIDGWHYPTVAAVSGTTTIKVQSLHQNSVTDAAYPDGDVTIVGGSCREGIIEPFDICSYEIESTGGEGNLYLSDSEVIQINKAMPELDNPGDNNSDDDDGGSMGLWSILLLGLMTWRRQFAFKTSKKLIDRRAKSLT